MSSVGAGEVCFTCNNYASQCKCLPHVHVCRINKKRYKELRDELLHYRGTSCWAFLMLNLDLLPSISCTRDAALISVDKILSVLASFEAQRLVPGEVTHRLAGEGEPENIESVKTG